MTSCYTRVYIDRSEGSLCKVPFVSSSSSSHLNLMCFLCALSCVKRPPVLYCTPLSPSTHSTIDCAWMCPFLRGTAPQSLFLWCQVSEVVMSFTGIEEHTCTRAHTTIFCYKKKYIFLLIN